MALRVFHPTAWKWHNNIVQKTNYQARHTKPNSGFALTNPYYDALLAFQIMVPALPAAQNPQLAMWQLNYIGGASLNLDTSLLTYVRNTTNGHDYVIYAGQDLGRIYPAGVAQSQIIINYKTYLSELIDMGCNGKYNIEGGTYQ